MLLRMTLIVALAAGVAADLAKDAHAAGDTGWMVRLRGVVVTPDDKSGNIRVGSTAVAGSGVDVDSDVIPELDITYKFARNWAAELILGYSKHTVTATGTLSALGDVIETKVLPPTLLLQYHFNPIGKFRPYIGGGLNYTVFFDSDVLGPLNQPGADVNLEQSFNVAGQFGFDYDINDQWFVNFDFKYIRLNTQANFANTTVAPAARIAVDVDLNPIVVGGGIGYRF